MRKTKLQGCAICPLTAFYKGLGIGRLVDEIKDIVWQMIGLEGFTSGLFDEEAGCQMRVLDLT